MNSLRCPNCNAAIEAYDRFCENCGTLLTGASPNAGASPESGQPAYAQPISSQAYEAATYTEPSYGTDYSQPAYAPTYGVPAPVQPMASSAAFGLAITSLVLGILGIMSLGVLFFIGIIGVILGIIALAMRSGYRKRGEYDSHAGATLGLSIAGIVTNICAILVFTLLLIIGIAAYDQAAESSVDLSDSTTIEQLLEELEA